MTEEKNPRTIIAVPAFNEEDSIGRLLREIHACELGYDVVVISDGSLDRTALLARENGAHVLDLPCNLGVGGAMQAAFRYAFEEGYDYLVRIDADGQHPPTEIRHLVQAFQENHDIDMVIGSRFLGHKSYTSTFLRNCGISGLAAALSMTCRKRVTDPTSGFQMLNRKLLFFFSRFYPMDYPEPEALALMRRQGYDFMEVAVTFRDRSAGQSTIRGWGTLYYVVKVFLALLVDRARPVDLHFSRSRVEDRL